ncbi:MAG: YcfL family protein [Kiritimatiellae bacterium]|nr:YcfL family protein [Kiritimatiellia bacterium]
MKISKIAVVTAFLAFAGCLSPKTSGVWVEKGHLYIEDAAFALNLNLVQDAMERTPEGFLHVQVTVQNTNQQDYPCQYRFEWKTKQGMVQTHASTPWRPVVFHGRDVVPLEAVSPLQGTDDFRLSIRRAGE